MLRILWKIEYFLKWFFPCRYYSEYETDSHKEVAIWRSWFGITLWIKRWNTSKTPPLNKIGDSLINNLVTIAIEDKGDSELLDLYIEGKNFKIEGLALKIPLGTEKQLILHPTLLKKIE